MGNFLISQDQYQEIYIHDYCSEISIFEKIRNVISILERDINLLQNSCESDAFDENNEKISENKNTNNIIDEWDYYEVENV